MPHDIDFSFTASDDNSSTDPSDPESTLAQMSIDCNKVLDPYPVKETSGFDMGEPSIGSSHHVTNETIADDVADPVECERDTQGGVPSSSSETDDEPPGDHVVKYGLRPQARKGISGFATTWFDQDNTGDYNPRAEQRVHRKQGKRMKAQGISDDIIGFDDRSEDDDTREVLPPRAPVTLLVKLKFTSEAKKAAVENCLEQPPANSELEFDDFFQSYQRRSKDSTRTRNREEVQVARRTSDTLHPADDLSGHPCARGCWGCHALSIPCPLLDDEGAWPCDHCVEDDHECELITEPARKQPCDRCKSKRVDCSYKYTTDHIGPCEDCVAAGITCFAGPSVEGIRHRIRYGWEGDKETGDWVPLILYKAEKDAAPVPTRSKRKPKIEQVLSCCHCSRMDVQCSLGTAVTEDCDACQSDGRICVPEYVRAPRKPRKNARKVVTPTKRGADEPAEHEAPVKKRTAALSPAKAFATPTKQSKHPVAEEPILTPAGQYEASREADDAEIPLPVGSAAPLSTRQGDARPSERPILTTTKQSRPSQSSDLPAISLPTGPTPPQLEPVTTPAKPKDTATAKAKPTTTSKSPISNSSIVPKSSLPTLPTKTITTPFSHPIIFNHDHGPRPCNFCTNASSFPLLGLEPVRVQVQTLPNGGGYRQISGGHIGIPQTRMCTPCTVVRLQIIDCQDHDMQSLGRKGIELDHEGALESLFADRLRERDKWCSICTSLGERVCGKCGLVLCRLCSAEWKEDVQGLLEGGGKGRPLGLRADSEFLKMDGLLMKFIMEE